MARIWPKGDVGAIRGMEDGPQKRSVLRRLALGRSDQLIPLLCSLQG